MIIILKMQNKIETSLLPSRTGLIIPKRSFVHVQFVQEPLISYITEFVVARIEIIEINNDRFDDDYLDK